MLLCIPQDFLYFQEINIQANPEDGPNLLEYLRTMYASAWTALKQDTIGNALGALTLPGTVVSTLKGLTRLIFTTTPCP